MIRGGRPSWADLSGQDPPPFAGAVDLPLKISTGSQHFAGEPNVCTTVSENICVCHPLNVSKCAVRGPPAKRRKQAVLCHEFLPRTRHTTWPHTCTHSLLSLALCPPRRRFHLYFSLFVVAWWAYGGFRSAHPALLSYVGTGDEDVLVSLGKAKAIADAIPEAKVSRLPTYEVLRKSHFLSPADYRFCSRPVRRPR